MALPEASANTNDVSSSAVIIQVVSSDGEVFDIDRRIAEQSSMLKMFADGDSTGPIPLPQVKASLLRSIIDFCRHHQHDLEPEASDRDDDDNYEPKRHDDISEWDQVFINQFTLSEGTLFEIIMAANYLGIRSLMLVGSKVVTNMVRGKSSAEVRQMFNISDSTDPNA